MMKKVYLLASLLLVLSSGTAESQGERFKYKTATFHDFLRSERALAQLEERLADKVPLKGYCYLAFCVCKDDRGLIVAVHTPSVGNRDDVAEALLQKSRSCGGCYSKAVIKKIGPSKWRVEHERWRHGR